MKVYKNECRKCNERFMSVSTKIECPYCNSKNIFNTNDSSVSKEEWLEE